MRRGFFIAAAFLALQAGAQEVPRHLAIARELVANVKPQDNRYVLGGELIRFPGEGGASAYEVKADCSGFLLATFARAQYPIRPQMQFLVAGPKRKRPRAEDFVLSIERESGFKRVFKVQDMRPGDLLAHAMLDKADQKETQTTGHVFLIDSLPREIAPKNPLQTGTTQYEVAVIDSNNEHVGDDDTRLKDPANGNTGLGRGTIRLYADEKGELVGWARTFWNTKRFFSYDPRFNSGTKPRKAAIGRPAA